MDEIKDLFASPPTEYSSAPLWVWNDMLTEEQVRLSMQDLAGQKVKQAIVHPRPGLMTPYLSDEWFRLWEAALDEAQRLDMNLWIYDENSYPSGFAGGLVPEAMPESRGRGIVIQEHEQPPKTSAETLAVYYRNENGYVNVTEEMNSGQALPEGNYLEVEIRYAPTDGWFGGKYYVDLLMPGVTEKFLEITMGAYERHIGNHFGKRVPGVFTDEPRLSPAGRLHWTGDLEKQFQQRWGYSLIDHLPSLFKPVGDFKLVRHNYYQTLLDLFIERWAKPCYEYYQKRELEFTGHYWDHVWPDVWLGSDNMAMYAWHQRPAVDILMNQYNEGTNAQFGNVRVVKELSSVANQLGLKRTLCEAYGAGGWDLRFEDMKRIGDWLFVLGVNTLDEHLSYITIRGARKRDHPQSFSYHEPWWEAYHVMAEYFSRLSAVLSQGQEVNGILVIEPTSSAWMYQGMDEELGRIGDSFQQLVTVLSKAQIEYDLGSEDIIARHGRINGSEFVVSHRSYHTVVIPPFTENLNSQTLELLEAFLRNGGTVLCSGEVPARVDGNVSDSGTRLSESKNWETVPAEQLVQRLASNRQEGFRIHRTESDGGILFHQRRHFEDGQILFLVNTSVESPAAGSIESACGGVEQWDLQTGQISPYQFTRVGEEIRANFALAPCGSLLLFLTNQPEQEKKSVEHRETTIPISGSMTARRIGPNVLTIDYVNVSAGGQEKKNVYYYPASQFVYQQHGMQSNPWESAVQFRDELICKTFDSKSGFEAEYLFTIEEKLPDRLWAVIERADLYEITCNGQTVTAEKGMWWLDKSFGRIDITQVAKLGPNNLLLKASPLTIYHELEPAYLIGEFTLKPAESGYIVLGSGSDMMAGSWKAQGCPFYAEGVTYTQMFDIDRPDGRYVVELENWYGSVAEVKVNDRQAGHIAYRPWQCDVTNLIRPGTNRIEITVIGTLKNTLGPHHNGNVLGSAWPGMFHKGPQQGPPPGEQYHTIDYGLFETFILKQVM